MTTVTGRARLHFGLLHVPRAGEPDARRFGGCGLMLDAPHIVVSADAAGVDSVEGHSAVRAARIVDQLRAAAPSGRVRPLAVRVNECPPEHVGLGVGTQLSLALAKALAAEWGADAGPLVAATGRGERSGVGLHGARLGGFVADCGRGPASTLAPLFARLEFPTDWPVVLAHPLAPGRWHGGAERAAFAGPAPDAGLTDAMCRLLVLGIIPAIAERDYPAFAASLYEYNRLAGAPFAASQGGTYSSPAVAGLVELASEFGFGAAGQSSWGEATFAIGSDAGRAEELAERMRVARPGWAVLVTRGWNGGG